MLDREVIIKLQEFLVRCDESKKGALQTSLNWLYHFIDFFRQDCQSGHKDQETILRQMYKDHIPDLISTIVRLKNSSKIEPRCSKMVEDINQRLLTTVILIFDTKEQYEFIFMRLKKEFKSESHNTS